MSKLPLRGWIWARIGQTSTVLFRESGNRGPGGSRRPAEGGPPTGQSSRTGGLVADRLARCDPMGHEGHTWPIVGDLL